MFFSPHLLIKSGGEFTLIWQLAHGKASKAIQTDIAKLDISAKCEALLKFLPTGQLTAAEVRNKMSLYLLATLQYGIVVAFARKTDIVLHDLTAAQKIFKQVIQKTPAKRKSTEDGQTRGKKARRTGNTTMATIPEADQDEQLIDLRNLPTEEISNRLQVEDLRQITLQEFDLQPPSFFEPDLRNFESMFQMALDEQSEHSREAANLQPARRADSNVESEEMQSLFAELVDGLDLEMVALNPLQRRFAMAENVALPPSEIEDAELARENVDTAPPTAQMTLDASELLMDQQLEFQPEPEIELQPELRPEQPEPMEVVDSFQLPALNESEILQEIQEQPPAQPEPVRRRRQPRPRNLIVDQRTELTDAEMRRNLQNIADICADRRPPAALGKVPGVAELFAPFPPYLPYGSEQWGPLFENAVNAALELVNNRAVASPAHTEERRESAAEIARRSSAISPFHEIGPVDLFPMVDQDIQPEFNDTTPLEPTEFVAPVAEPILEQTAAPNATLPYDISADRQESAAELARQSTRFSPFNDPSRMDIAPLADDQDYPLQIVNETVAAEQAEPEPIADFTNLLERIKSSKVNDEPVAFLRFANKASKPAVARDFINLLYLLKHRMVHVEQAESYGVILVQPVDN